MSKRDPLDQFAAFRTEVGEEMRARDLQEIRAELRRNPPEPVGGRRRWALGVVVSLIVAGPAAAVASIDSAPGDLLYPVKRAVEPMLQIFDSDVAVEHRVEEVATLVERQTQDDVIEQRIDIARDALAETDQPLLEQELDRIVDRWVSDRARSTPAVTDEPVSTTTAPEEPVRDGADQEVVPPPADPTEPTTTTQNRPSDTEPSDRPTTSTRPQDGEEPPPPDDRPRDTP